MKLVRVIGPDVLRIGLVQIVIDSLLQQRPPGFDYGIVTCTKSNNKETIVACGYHEHSGRPVMPEPSYEDLERYFFDRELCHRDSVAHETVFANLAPRDNAYANLRNLVLNYRSLVSQLNESPNNFQFPALSEQDRIVIHSALTILLSWLAFTDIIPDVQLIYPCNIRQGNIEGCILRVYPNIPDPQVWRAQDNKLRNFLQAFGIAFAEQDGAIQGNDFAVTAVMHLADAILRQCDVKPPMVFVFNSQSAASTQLAEEQQQNQMPGAAATAVSYERPGARL